MNCEKNASAFFFQIIRKVEMGEGVKNMSLNFDNTRIREHMLDGQFGNQRLWFCKM